MDKMKETSLGLYVTAKEAALALTGDNFAPVDAAIVGIVEGLERVED